MRNSQFATRNTQGMRSVEVLTNLPSLVIDIG